MAPIPPNPALASPPQPRPAFHHPPTPSPPAADCLQQGGVSEPRERCRPAAGSQRRPNTV